MPYYIYSTISNDVKYCIYSEKPEDLRKDLSVPIHEFLINGKANIANKHLITPRGVMTKISDDDFSILKENATFQRHVKNGFIAFEKKEFAIDRVIKDMKPKDNSAPITPAFYEGKGSTVPKPVVIGR